MLIKFLILQLLLLRIALPLWVKYIAIVSTILGTPLLQNNSALSKHSILHKHQVLCKSWYERYLRNC